MNDLLGLRCRWKSALIARFEDDLIFAVRQLPVPFQRCCRVLGTVGDEVH